ncbi:MAG: YbhB/YbcL family Raf kinase inhibitor-like protein [Desulfovibrionaceae bacterium]
MFVTSKGVIGIVLCLLLLFTGCSSQNVSEKKIEEKKIMFVTSSGIVDGIIEDKYGKRGDQFLKGMPTFSLPLSIQNAPVGTKSFAVVMEDKDAIPVTGFSWIHWTLANLEVVVVPENASAEKNLFVQGANSWSAPLLGENALSREESSMYGGAAPPDTIHEYEIRVYALDTKLDLQEGFYLNELYKAMNGHILATFTLVGTYSN